MTGAEKDRIDAAKAARLKYFELDELVHQLPYGHPLRGAMRHTLSKLWMFARETFDPSTLEALGDHDVKR